LHVEKIGKSIKEIAKSKLLKQKLNICNERMSYWTAVQQNSTRITKRGAQVINFFRKKKNALATQITFMQFLEHIFEKKLLY
jgi:hypothetical protein